MKPQTLQQAYQKGWNDCLKWVVEDLQKDQSVQAISKWRMLEDSQNHRKTQDGKD